MLYMIPEIARQVVEETLRVLLVTFSKVWVLSILVLAVVFGIVGHLSGGSGIELALEVVSFAAPPFILAQVQLMLVVGFVFYLGLISCRDLYGIQPSYLTSKLYTKILESARYWMSLVFSDIRALQSPNLTSRWFAYPERAANHATRYPPRRFSTARIDDVLLKAITGAPMVRRDSVHRAVGAHKENVMKWIELAFVVLFVGLATVALWDKLWQNLSKVGGFHPSDP